MVKTRSHATMLTKQSQGLSSPMKGSGSPYDLESSRASPSRSDGSVSDDGSSVVQQPAARRDGQRARRTPAPRAGKAKPKSSKPSPKAAAKRLKPAGRHVQQLAKRLNAAAVAVSTDGRQSKAKKAKAKKEKVVSPDSSDSDDDAGMMKPKGASFGPVAATHYRRLTKALFLRAGEIPRGAVCISLPKWRVDVWRLALVVLDSSTYPSDVYKGSHFSPTGSDMAEFRKECALVDFGSEKLVDQACEIYGLTVMAVDDLCKEHDQMVAENLANEAADRHDVRAVMASQVLRRLGPLNRMWSSLRGVGKKVKK